MTEQELEDKKIRERKRQLQAMLLRIKFIPAFVRPDDYDEVNSWDIQLSDAKMTVYLSDLLGMWRQYGKAGVRVYLNQQLKIFANGVMEDLLSMSNTFWKETELLVGEEKS